MEQIDPKLITWTGNRGILELSSSPLRGALELKPLKVTSPKTGVTKDFYFSRTLWDHEGEAVAYIFVSSCGSFELHVVND